MPVTPNQTSYLTSLARSDSFPIFLIHGAGGNALSWPAAHRHLPKQTVYSIDLAGHGNSKNNSFCGINYYANQVLDLMDYLRIPKAILVGHSMGGGISMSLAIDHPSRVAGLGLISTAASLRLPDPLRDLTIHPETYPELVDQLIGYSFSSHTPRSTIRLVRSRLLDLRPSVLINDLNASEIFDISNKAGLINVPTIVMVGDNDQMTPLRYSIHLNGLIQNSALRIIPEKGHMLPIEAPDDVADGIIELAENVRQVYFQSL